MSADVLFQVAMLIFIDTEFTSLNEPYLISAGFVAADGRELYVELLGTSCEICSSFVIKNVLPMLNGPGLSPSQVAELLVDFLADYTNIVWFCDAPRYDLELIKPFLPRGLRWKFAVPSFDSEAQEQEYLGVQEEAFANGLRRHHALDDARAMRRAWLRIHLALGTPNKPHMSPADEKDSKRKEN